jgi:methyl-accepting chemotaxis protein
MKHKRRPTAMKITSETQELFGQFSNKAVEALALWTDANQKIVQELADLSAHTLKEGVQFYGKLQASALEAAKEGQGYWFRRQGDFGDWQKDPFACYQKSLVEGIQEAQKAFKLVEGNAQAVTLAAEQLQATSQKAAKEIQQTFSALATDLKVLYTPSKS